MDRILIDCEILGYIDIVYILIILDEEELFSYWFYTEYMKGYIMVIFIEWNKSKFKLSLVTSVLENIVLD